MTTLQQLRAAFRETLRLFAAEPLGMVSVVFRRLINGMDDAQARLRQIEAAHPALIPQATRDEPTENGQPADSETRDSAAQKVNS